MVIVLLILVQVLKVGSQDPQLKMNKWEMAQQIKDLQADNADLRAELKAIKMALQKLQ